MGKRNNVIPNRHFHKDWQRFAKTCSKQPTRKYCRKENCVKKARAVVPRPDKFVKPIVCCPTFRYHTKIRAGKGFTLEELKASGLNKRLAQTIGIAVDPRRHNKSIESLQMNAQCLKEYKSKLILFPLNQKKPKKDDTIEGEMKLATQVIGEVMPIVHQTPAKPKARVIFVDKKKISVYVMLRKARADARLLGIRAKRIKDAAENPEDVTKAAKDNKPKK